MSTAVQDAEQLELLRSFIEEAREMLDEVEPRLIELEKGSIELGSVDGETINSIFRLFHSLKGSAGYLDLQTISRITHQAETLLDFFRKGAAALERRHVDLLIRSCDFLRHLLENVEMSQHDGGFDSQADTLLKSLQECISNIQSAPLSKSKSSAAKKKNPAPEKKKSPPAAKQKASKAAPASRRKESKDQPEEGEDMDLQLCLTAEMSQQFINEAQELLGQAEEALLNLEKDSEHSEEHIAQAFRALHSLKGNAGLFGYGDLEKLSHHAESVLELIKEGQLNPDRKIFSILLEIIDILRGAVASLAESGSPGIPGLQGWVSLLEECSREAATGEDIGSSSHAAERNSVSLKGNEKAEKSNAANLRAESQVAAGSETDAGQELLTERRAGADRRTGEDRRQKDAAQRQSVRVDVEKLDILLDLVGELVIAEAMVAQNPDLKCMNGSLDRFERSVMHLQKISRDLQDAVTSIRMIPLSGTFRKMIRLVRDLSLKAGKQVELEIIGEETEVDKTVIEQINDPLVHLIRNAIDHGLEPPEMRTAQGKPAQGTVVLEAKYVGSEVWITIRDDGRGLSREKILAKALERNLISGDGSDLRDDEVWQIVFMPGFSTADTITDVSGRGVGMDVVKRNIENIRGKVDMRSQAGQGSTVILRIPLTLAIIDGMLVRVGNSRYIVPIATIKETLKPQEGDITRLMDGQEILNMRGKLLPVVRLHESLKMGQHGGNLMDGLVIVAEGDGQSVCLFVDELYGQQQVVIKGLSSYIGDRPGISGCTIMGDGDVSLILDIASIVHMAQTNAEVVKLARSV